MMIRAVIVDDDPLQVEELLAHLQQSSICELEVIATFNDPMLARDFIDRSEPDLLFLDIQMPALSGFEMLDQLHYKNSEVIFVTSYDEYAIRAIRYSAIDYILKPFSSDDIDEALNRYLQHSERIQVQTRLNNLKSNLQAKKNEELHLVVSTKQGEYRFMVNDIVRCEADSNYTMLHLRGNRRFVASKTLGDIETMLADSEFLRVHKSHVVNTRHIEHLTVEGNLYLSNGEKVPVSRRRMSEVKSHLRT
jgi:two-component system LytT family response regulator